MRNSSPELQTHKVGKIGEAIARKQLETEGYKILEQNYRTASGELDLVAQLGAEIVFVEVKTRRNLKFGLPQEAVTLAKQKQISKVAVDYLQKNGLMESPCRFDVFALFLARDGTLIELNQIKNAFEFCL